MPRKVTKSLVRQAPPDRLYNSTAVSKLINRFMLDGKKQMAEKLVYSGMQKAADKLKVQNPLEVFEQAMNNVRPHLETRSRRVGGANYQIPFEVKGQRQQHLTTMWFVEAVRARSGMPTDERIAAELVEAYNNGGAAVKKKEDTHRMADANRAFAHFARN
jgi:small subunit ribosomal protein S7